MEIKDLKVILSLIENDIAGGDNKFSINPKQYIEYFHILYYNIVQGKSIVDIAKNFNNRLFVNSATNVILNQVIDLLVDKKIRDFRIFLSLDDTSALSGVRYDYNNQNGVLFNIGNDKLDKLSVTPFYRNEFKLLLKLLGSKDFALLLIILYKKTELFSIIGK